MAAEVFDVKLDPDGTVGIELHIKNVGDATATDANLMILASSPKVHVQMKGSQAAATDPHALIVPPSSFGAFAPYTMSKLERFVAVTVAPNGEKNFQLTFKMWGANFDAHEVVMRLNVPDAAPAAPEAHSPPKP